MSNPGRERFRRVQWGRESAIGTPVAETTRWRGMGGTLEPEDEIEEIEERIGYIDGADRTNVVSLLGKLGLEKTSLTPQQYQYLNVMAFAGPHVGVADGAGSGYVYTTNIPSTEANTPNVSDAKPYTVVTGDDRARERMEYCVCTKQTVTGGAGKTLQVGGELKGRQILPYAPAWASVAVPPVTDIAASRGRVYIDAISGTYGTTLVSGTIITFELEISIMWQPVNALWGQLYPEFMKYTGHEITGKLTFEHDTAALDAKADSRLQTPRLLRVAYPGNALITPGTLYSTEMVIFDLPIKYKVTPSLSDKDGNDTVTMAFRSRANLTAGNAGKIVVVNTLATLP